MSLENVVVPLAFTESIVKCGNILAYRLPLSSCYSTMLVVLVKDEEGSHEYATAIEDAGNRVTFLPVLGFEYLNDAALKQVRRTFNTDVFLAVGDSIIAFHLHPAGVV